MNLKTIRCIPFPRCIAALQRYGASCLWYNFTPLKIYFIFFVERINFILSL